MFDHVDVALIVLDFIVNIEWFVASLYYFDLLDVLLSNSLQSSLQKVPEEEINHAIQQKYSPKQRLGEHAEKAVVCINY